MTRLLLLIALSGCFNARYLAQAAAGQFQLIAAARPLSTAIRNPSTPPHVQKLLATVPVVKAFGEKRGLKATKNYERYIDLHRGAAVYVVQACHPLKFEPKRWSFPIVGTVPYLGFFDEASARAYAKRIEEEEHLDVDVRGASAYSTLGWFKDPVLSTMISDGPDALGWLANTVLHESVHATLYIPGQSSFDESLASFVADKLTLEWLSSRLGPASKELKSYTESAAQGLERVARLHQAYEDLAAIYASSASDDDKRAQKAGVLAKLRADLKTRRDFNNATLVGYRTYDTGGPAFERLLQRCGGDLGVFLETVQKLEPSSFPQPQMEDFSPVIDGL